METKVTAEKNVFHKAMERIAVMTALVTICFLVIYHTCRTTIFLSCAIAAGTTCYHFVMRLAVGYFVRLMAHKELNDENRWFREKAFERALYRRLKVKYWKEKMPTYNPEDFSIRDDRLEKMIQTMCISELVHEIIVLLSFIPVLFALAFDSFPVFMTTSIIAALFDSCFVIMQRYNRPRVKKILARKRKKNA